MRERITSHEQALAIYRQATELYEKGDFEGAISLYDELLQAPPWLINPYEVRKVRAMAYCKVERFEEAEQELEDLMNVLSRFGEPSSGSQVRYWYLMAKYRGDQKRVMEEILSAD